MKQTIKTIVIDDEPYSRAELIHLLNAYPAIEIIGEAESGKEGLEKSLMLEPNVVFVDINMGEMSGMEMVQLLKKVRKPPQIVFATAYPDYAAKAFRYNAIDYLLKPFSEEDLAETMERIMTCFDQEEGTSVNETLPSKLAIELDDSILYVSPKEILFCCRFDRETLIFTRDEKYQSKITLKDLEEKLQVYSFFRTHKSFLVNLKKVEKLVPWFNGAYQVKVTGYEKEIPVSRNYVKRLRELLEL